VLELGEHEGGFRDIADAALLLTERYVAGRSQNLLVTGLARRGGVLAAAVAGACAVAGALLAPLEAGDHRPVPGLLAPACRRDVLGCVRAV
jgi:hypothetical protein